MDIIAEYKQQTGSQTDGGKCADCANAVWRIMRADAPDAYDAARNCSLAVYCMTLGKPVTHIIYKCSAHAVSDAAQGAELAGML